MKRYLQVLSLFWSTAIAAELEYRLNFIIATLTSLASLSGSIFSLFLFYRTGYNFPGWTWQEALIVLGIFTLLQGFSSTFLVPNLNRIVEQVEQGTLDFVLLKPISSQFWLSGRILSPWGFPDLFFGLINLKMNNLGLGCFMILFYFYLLFSVFYLLFFVFYLLSSIFYFLSFLFYSLLFYFSLLFVETYISFILMF